MNLDRLGKKKSKPEEEKKKMIKLRSLEERKLLRIMKPGKGNKKNKWKGLKENYWFYYNNCRVIILL